MKRNLRVGERYVLSKHKPKQKTIRYVSLLAVLTSMCLYAVKQVSAQEAEPAATAADIKPLQIGEVIPEWLWQLPLPIVSYPPTGGRDTLTLNDHRGKLIILDFWATWCTSCLKKFPDIAKYNEQFADSLMILLVNTRRTRDDLPKIERVLAQRGSTLTSIVNDEVLGQLFPIHMLPYQVWIDDQGRLRAFTFNEFFTPETISAGINRINTLKSRRQKWKRQK